MLTKIFELVSLVLGYVIPAIKKSSSNGVNDTQAEEFREKRDKWKKRRNLLIAISLTASIGIAGTCCSHFDVKSTLSGGTDIYFSPSDSIEGSLEFGSGLEVITLHFADTNMIPEGSAYELAVERRADGIWLMVNKVPPATGTVGEVK